MKNIVSKIMLLGFVVTMFGSCRESLYDEKFEDPTKSPTVDFGNLMVGTNLYSREWAMSGYGRFFGWESQVLMKQVNTVGLTLDPGYFYSLEGYTDGMPPLGELSKMIASYKFMESLYADMDESGKTANKVYMLAAETQLYAFTAYIVSLFGDIPFDEVGQVSITGDVALAHPHYQDDQQIYETILDRLGEMNTEWAAITDVPASFNQQDFINKGNLDKWRRYNNSLRLKTALMVSTQGPLTTKGQDILREILGNADANPVIDNNDQNVVIAQVNQSGSALDINGGSGFDWINQRTAAAEIIKRMQAAGDGGAWSGVGKLSIPEGATINTATTDDPRLPIMFTLATPNGEFAVLTEAALTDTTIKYANGKAIPSVYTGASASMDPNDWEHNFQADYRASFSYIRVNGFFRDNRNWDNPIITAAEVNFIKAEAFLRGWATGDAKAAFKDAIKASIKSYFHYHENRSVTEVSFNSDGRTHQNAYKCIIDPDQSVYNDAWIDAFAEARWTTRVDGSSYGADGSLEAILEQKWLNYGYMYAGEQWTDLRRTGYPRMYYQKDPAPGEEVPYPANRNRYPESERNNNMNYEAEVSAQDNWSDVLFWAIPNWHDGPTW